MLNNKKSHQLVSGSAFLDTADLFNIFQSLQGDQGDTYCSTAQYSIT